MGTSESTDTQTRPPSQGVLAWMTRPLRKWAELVKFSHTVFALPFALASMAVAARENHGWPGTETFLLILLAMVAARTCAMTFNRIVDRPFDRANPRTADRPLVTGEVRLTTAWLLWAISGVAFLGAAYLLNPLCFALSPLVLFVICFYSLTKRFTDFTHVFLGIALGLAPIGAWLAVQGEITFRPLRESFLLPLVLAGAVVFWLIGFDIIYAVQDYEFDRRQGLHSLAVRWGIPGALRFAKLSHLIMWGALALFGLLSGFGVAYFVGLLFILASLLLEHWLARKRSLKWVDTAFFRLNALISLVFLTIVWIEVILPGVRVIQ